MTLRQVSCRVPTCMKETRALPRELECRRWCAQASFKQTQLKSVWFSLVLALWEEHGRYRGLSTDSLAAKRWLPGSRLHRLRSRPIKTTSLGPEFSCTLRYDGSRAGLQRLYRMVHRRTAIGDGYAWMYVCRSPSI
jgi:hypothetical protein